MPSIGWRGLTPALLVATIACAEVHAPATQTVASLPARQPDAAGIVPFDIDVPGATLVDLKTRLARTRLGSEIPGSGWEYGTDLTYLRQLIAYWRDGFDWREQEQRLNQFDQFKTQIDGLDIHFVWQRAGSTDALPLLLVHGYPDSFVTYAKVIDPLADPTGHGGRPEDAFDIVVPSLPGYGFSDRPQEPGWGTARVAGTFATLMARLGYARYGIQGAGLGCAVATQMALNDRAHIVGAHFNDCAVSPPPDATDPFAAVPAAERDRMTAREEELRDENAYLEMNSAKPQSVTYELTDSPGGLAAWIVDKYRAWCDCDGDPETKFTKDELLTNITVYWVTATAGSAARIFRESRGDPDTTGLRVAVPTGFAVFPKNITLAPRSWVEARYNVTRWTEMSRGGHFAALEEPELFVDDLRAFFQAHR